MKYHTIPRPAHEVFKHKHLAQPNAPRAQLSHVEYPKDGFDILVHYKNVPYPKLGFPYPEALLTIGAVKRLAIISAKIARQAWFLIPFMLPIALIFKQRLLKVLLEQVGYQFCYRLNEAHYIEHRRMARPVREVVRAGYTVAKKYPILTNENGHLIGENLTEVFALILEYDDAYRERFQDIIPEINKEALRKNHRKEIMRLVEIMIDREMSRAGGKDRYVPMGKMVGWAMTFSPALKRLILNIVDELDFEKIKQNDAEYYWSLFRGDYNIGGIQITNRQMIGKKIDAAVRELNEQTLKLMAV